MSSPFVVPDQWKITSWTPEPADEALPDGIPTDGVQPNGPLDITFDPSDDSFTLRWVTQSGVPVTALGLKSDPAQTILSGQDLTVSFGEDSVQCDLTVTLGLTCKINLSELSLRRGDSGVPETGGGTFTATANGG